MLDRYRKALQTRDAILDAAIDLFVKEGFEKTSMDAIALAAGVAKGTLYYHFASKEGIIDAVVERYARTMEARLDAVEADQSLTLVERMEAFSRVTKEVSAATFSKLHYVRYVDIHQKTSVVIIGRVAPYLARIIEEGNRAGAWRVAHPLEFAEIVSITTHELIDPEVGAEKLPRRIAAVAWLCARIFDLPLEAFQRIFSPLENLGNS